MVLVFYVQELPKAQPPVVLVFKASRRQGNGLKSHPTDWEKLGIEPATQVYKTLVCPLQNSGFSVISEKCYKVTILQRNYRSMFIFL